MSCCLVFYSNGTCEDVLAVIAVYQSIGRWYEIIGQRTVESEYVEMVKERLPSDDLKLAAGACPMVFDGAFVDMENIRYLATREHCLDERANAKFHRAQCRIVPCKCFHIAGIESVRLKLGLLPGEIGFGLTVLLLFHYRRLRDSTMLRRNLDSRLRIYEGLPSDCPNCSIKCRRIPRL